MKRRRRMTKSRKAASRVFSPTALRVRKGISQAKQAVLLLAAQTSHIAIPSEPEHHFHPTRRWRFDLAWPAVRVAVEVQGGQWIKGGHTSGHGLARDCEKLAEAAALGWRVIPATYDMVSTGQAASLVERAIRHPVGATVAPVVRSTEGVDNPTHP